MDNKSTPLRALKLWKILQDLSPDCTGSLGGASSLVSLASSCEIPGDLKVNVDRPIHIVIKTIATDIISVMKDVAESNTDALMQFNTDDWKKQRIDKYILSAYPMLVSLGFKLLVENPKVTVVDVGEKGLGVVATENIVTNTIVAFYPIDVLRIRCFHESLREGPCAFFSPYKQWRDSPPVNSQLEKYKYTIANTDIIGDPSLYSDASCGHIVNDGDGPIKGTNNSMLVPLFGGVVVAVVAIMDIEPGTEILAAYGKSYWED